MDVSELILNYLIKESGADISVPLDDCERFQLYSSLVKHADLKKAGNTYLRAEETYLSRQLMKNDITDIDGIPENISALNVNPAFCRADALLNNITDTESDVFLYSGTEFKLNCAENAEKSFFVTGGGNLCYKGIINCAAPVSENKITSDFTSSITLFYRCAADIAIKGKLKTLVVPEVPADNVMVKNHIAKLAVNELNRAQPFTKVLFAVTESSLSVYRKYISEL